MQGLIICHHLFMIRMHKRSLNLQPRVSTILKHSSYYNYYKYLTTVCNLFISENKVMITDFNKKINEMLYYYKGEIIYKVNNIK